MKFVVNDENLTVKKLTRKKKAKEKNSAKTYITYLLLFFIKKHN